ncbi:MAG TPA: hypothetical protein VGB20_06795 [bacterium]
MRSLALIVSRGETLEFVQALTFLMAAVHSEMSLRVLFRHTAAARLTPAGINAFDPSGPLAADPAALRERLRRLDLLDAQRLLRDIKESGDVRYYACSSSLAVAGLERRDLIPEIDEVRGLPAFLMEDAKSADRFMTL